MVIMVGMGIVSRMLSLVEGAGSACDGPTCRK
jgi:hypothetical protein